jgi:hypothetical protein
VIRGARQVGKSYLIKQFAAQEFENIIEINLEYDKDVLPYFEKPDLRDSMQLLSIHKNSPVKEGATLLFLDELQAAPQLLAKLRYFHEKIPGLHVVAAGSLLDFVLEDHTFSMPVGRIEYLHLGPMTFSEFLSATRNDALTAFLREFSWKKEIPVPLHEKLINLFKQYLIVGGMPESIQAFAESGSYRESDRVKQSILVTYIDDFAKYGKRISHELLTTVFRALPHFVGKTLKYSHLSQDFRAEELARALHFLSLARIGYLIRHSSCEGIPLGATVNKKKIKPLFLDVGLLSSACGLSMVSMEQAANLLLINNGSVTEQFIGQHLLYRQEPYLDPELYFWSREKPASNAEIDYAVSIGTQIIPIEVKAGTTGSLKSLNQFMIEKKYPLAVRFNLDRPSVCQSTGRMPAGDSYDYTLVSLPCYLVEQVERLVDLNKNT